MIYLYIELKKADLTLSLQIVGDALIAMAFVRNGLSAATIFATSPWLEALGLHNTFTSIGCLSLGFGLLCVPMIVWGKKARLACAKRYAFYASRQMDCRYLR